MTLSDQLADLEGRLARRLEEALVGYRQQLAERLRSESARLLAAPEEVHAPGVDALLADFDFAALAGAAESATEESTLAALLAGRGALEQAQSQAEVLEALLDAALDWSERAALWLASEEGVTVWGTRGELGGAEVGREIAWGDLPRERLLADRGCLRFDAAAAGELTPALGFAARGAAVIVPLVLRNRIAALLWADRSTGPPALAALQLLVAAAADRLELQALSERTESPTLAVASETEIAPLPLWSALPPSTPSAPAATAEDSEAPPETVAFEMAPAPPAAPPAEELDEAREAEDAGGEIWETEPAPVEPEPAPEVRPVEELFGVAPVEPAPEPSAPTEPAPLPPPEVEPIAEPEPEAAAEPAGASGGAALEETAPPLDLHGTVRMVLPSVPAAGEERPREEATAPFPVQPAAPPAPPELPPPPPAAEPDITEDATQLSMRRPEVVAPPPPPPPPPVEDPHDRTASRIARSTEVAPPPDLDGPGLAFTGLRAARAAGEHPAHEEARRLARLLISEIKLYNEEQVLEGRRSRDLYHRLKEDIDRSGRSTTSGSTPRCARRATTSSRSSSAASRGRSAGARDLRRA
jgi:hypothetical protein